jgi:hypothetical protein
MDNSGHKSLFLAGGFPMTDAATPRDSQSTPGGLYSACPKFEFCLPTLGKAVPAPSGFTRSSLTATVSAWNATATLRLITRGGYDWTKRFPWIVEAMLKNRGRQFVKLIDGRNGKTSAENLRIG